MNPKHCIIDDFYVEEIAEHGQVVAPPSGRSPQLCLSVFIWISHLWLARHPCEFVSGWRIDSFNIVPLHHEEYLIFPAPV